MMECFPLKAKNFSDNFSSFLPTFITCGGTVGCDINRNFDSFDNQFFNHKTHVSNDLHYIEYEHQM